MLSEPPPYYVKVRDYFKKQSGVWSFFSKDREKGGDDDEKMKEDREIVERIIDTIAVHPDSDAALLEMVRRFRLGEKLVEGPMQLDRLDIMEQEELRERTRALLVAYLGAEWVRTPGVMTLAREYFADMGEDDGGRAETRARADDEGREETGAGAETEGPETATREEMGAGIEAVARADDGGRETAVREEMGAGKGGGTQVAIRAGGEMGINDVAREKTEAGIEAGTGTRDGGWKDAGVRNEMGTRADDVAGIDDGTKTENDARKDNARGDDAGRGSAAGAGNDTKAAPNEMTLEGAHISIQKYFAYVLLDLVLADPRLGNALLEHARRLAGVLGIVPVFDGILKKEMIYPYDNHGQDML